MACAVLYDCFEFDETSLNWDFQVRINCNELVITRSIGNR